MARKDKSNSLCIKGENHAPMKHCHEQVTIQNEPGVII